MKQVQDSIYVYEEKDLSFINVGRKDVTIYRFLILISLLSTTCFAKDKFKNNIIKKVNHLK